MILKRFIIKLLFRLIGSPYLQSNNKIQEEKMGRWLGEQFPLKPFGDYIEKRDKELLQQIGNMTSREVYIMLIGQRVELGRLYSYAKECFNQYADSRQHKKFSTTRKHK